VSRRVLIGAEALAALALVVVSVCCWLAGVQTTHFSPVAERSASFDSTTYSGPWIVAASVAFAAAAVLAIDVFRRFRGPVETPPAVPAGGIVGE
jgi:hypothetical protein